MQIVNDTKNRACMRTCVRACVCVCVCVRKQADKIEREREVSTVSTLLGKKKCHYIGS